MQCLHHLSPEAHPYPPHANPPKPSTTLPPITLPPQPLSISRYLCSVLRPLPTKESQPPFLRLERNLAALWKKEHVALCRLDALPTLIRYFKIAIHNDFHLVIGIGVDERSARLEAVEPGGYWVLGAATVRKGRVESAYRFS